MNTFTIRYQTSELTSPPYAHATEIKGTVSATELAIRYQVEYLGRDQLTEEEIEEEGFTTEDDFVWEGNFGVSWAKALTECLVFGPQPAPESKEDFWEIEVDGNKGYPQDAELMRVVIEQLRQAIFEKEAYEMPLRISLLKVNSSGKEEAILEASFEHRKFTLTNAKGVQQKPWLSLEKEIQSVYSGEFDYELATTKKPTKNGLYVNLGDEWWFEMGKSYFNTPSKLQRYF